MTAPATKSRPKRGAWWQKSRARKPNTTPTEHAEQVALFQWLALASKTHPELALAYAIPNGGHRNIVTAQKLKAEGVKPGVPDICLPITRRTSGALYIELKRQQGGAMSPEQKWWAGQLQAQGHSVALCHGWNEARLLICEYMGIQA